MTKQQAIYASYMLAESLNDLEIWYRLKPIFGRHGRLMVGQAISSMATEFNFQEPVIMDVEDGDDNSGLMEE